MKNLISMIVLTLGIITAPYSYGLYEVNSFSNHIAAGPELTLAA